MKKSILTLFIILGISLLSSKDESVFLKQVELENIYRVKIESFLEKLYDKTEYYVFADVRLEEKSDPESEKQEDTSTTSTENESSDPFGYTFIEGLGLNPTLPTAPINTRSNKEKKEAKKQNEYIMTGLNISVYLAEDIYTVESRETITNFVNTNIDEIRNCFDCFVLERMPNHNSQSMALDDERFRELQTAYDNQTSKIEAIIMSHETLKDSIKRKMDADERKKLRTELTQMIEQNEAERAILTAKINEVITQKDTELGLRLDSKDKELNFLIRQLDDATSARMFWEDQEARRNELQNNLDSLKYINLLSIQEEYRAKQNKLLEDISGDYESSIQARINDAKGTEERLFKLIESNNSASIDTKANGVDIEGYKNSSNKTILYIIIIVAVVAVIAALIILLTRKKKVIYLKPKGTDGNNQGSSAQTKPAFTAPPTTSNENTDVVRSEVRSLRQSAVTMSAGQKEGASQIISDWLDEGSDENDSDDENNSEKEE